MAVAITKKALWLLYTEVVSAHACVHGEATQIFAYSKFACAIFSGHAYTIEIEVIYTILFTNSYALVQLMLLLGIVKLKESCCING